MNLIKYKTYSIILLMCASSLIAYSQFGTLINMTESVEESSRQYLERKQQREQERKQWERELAKVRKHNEWVKEQTAQLHSGKQAGVITIVVGVVITCLGGIISIASPSSKK